jgi:hypothetical protein
MYSRIHASYAASRQVKHELYVSHTSRSVGLHRARIRTSHERYTESLVYPRQAALEP